MQRAWLMNTPGTALPVTKTEGMTEIHGPNVTPDHRCSVVAVEVEGAPIVYQAPKIEADSDFLVDTLTVSINAGSGELTVRYTIDNSELTTRSRKYTGTFMIDTSVMVKARAFHQDKPVTRRVHRHFTKVDAVPAVDLTDTRLIPGLKCSVYRGDWNSLPDFNALQPAQMTGVVIRHAAGPPGAQCTQINVQNIRQEVRDLVRARPQLVDEALLAVGWKQRRKVLADGRRT